MVSTRSQVSDGPGKTRKSRRHQEARTPYSRLTAGQQAALTPNNRTSDVGIITGIDSSGNGKEGPSSLLRSVGGTMFSAATTPLRAAASLVQRVCSHERHR